jgi:hypothetical protein
VAPAIAAPPAGLSAAEPTRLFTYKVAVDRGSAPNPYFGVCTLALCKPRIRKHAMRGDIVIGCGCKSRTDPDEAFRIVHVMQIDEVLPWPEYVERCRTSLRGKIPDGSSPERYVGDCIYVLEGGMLARTLRCGSGHGAESYRRDVLEGRNVLLANRYWYFGGGDRERVVLPGGLHALSPLGIGHRVDKNQPFIGELIGWFNAEVARRGLPPGVHGRPKDAVAPPPAGAPGDVIDAERRRC